MKNKYREETNKDVYSNDMCCGCGGSDGSYSDEYVKWLESEVKKLHIQNVSNRRELLFAFGKYLEEKNVTDFTPQMHIDNFLSKQ